MLRWWIFIALLAAAGCSREAASRAVASASAPVPVRTARVIGSTAPIVTTVSGTIRPVQRAVIAARITGSIVELPVTLGQHVAAGDLLVRLSAAELEARVAQAETQLAQARRELARETTLLASGAAADDSVKNLTERVTMAEAALREAQTNLSYTVLRAPFDGVVAKRPAYGGDLATPGTPLLGLEGETPFEIEVPVPETLARALHPGTSLAVSCDDGSFAAPVSEISSAADPVDRNVLVKLGVPGSAVVRSGEFARVDVPGSSALMLLAPASAITTFGQMERAFVVTPEGRASLRLVTTGARRGDQVEILAGLDAGEQVIVDPISGMRDGQAVALAR